MSTVKEAKFILLEGFGEPKRDDMLVSFWMPHLEAWVKNQLVDPFSIVGWFMYLCSC